RGPGDDVSGMNELIGLGAQLNAHNGLEPCFAGGRTNRTFEFGSAKACEKPAVHGSAIQRAEGSAIGIGQNRFGAELGNDGAFAPSLPSSAPKRFCPIPMA